MKTNPLEGTMVKVLAEYTSFDGSRVTGTWIDPCLVVSIDSSRAKNSGDATVSLLSPDGTMFKQPLRNIVPASFELRDLQK